MTGDVTINSVIRDTQKTQQQSTQLAEDFNDFLVLLTTQLQNQDPLSPMDTTEFTNQIVAFSGVEQQINTNKKLDSLVQLNLSNLTGAALNYIGLDISYIGQEVSYDGQTPVGVSYVLEQEAAKVKVNVLDEKGDVVFSGDGPSNGVGPHSYQWDGLRNNGFPAEAGVYTIRVDALDAKDKPISSSSAVTGRVSGIETQNGILFLLVGERAVPVEQVLNAKKPSESPTAAPAPDITPQPPANNNDQENSIL